MEPIHFEGILRIYEFSGDEEWSEYQPWWPRFSLSEKQHKGHLVVEVKNLITNAGRTQLLTFAGSSGTTTAFSQFYAVGTGAIFVVQANDTSLATELFRLAPASYSIVGNGVTVTTNFSTSQANGSWTNAGIFGNGATSTPGSGTLLTHVLATYTKTSSIAVANDYLISLT